MTYLFLSFDRDDIAREAVGIYGSLIGRRVGYGKAESGAPILDEGYVSVSHKAVKGRRVGAVAVGDAPVGVDIEIVNDTVPFERIRDRFFGPKEREIASDIDGFYRVWTAKECVGKRRGTGFIFGDREYEESVEYFVFGDVIVALCADCRPYIVFV